MKKILRNVFENIFWPAAAGNVVWSFCNVAVNPTYSDPTESDIGMWPRLAVLFLFSLYLIISWLQLRATITEIKPAYWCFEAGHLFTLAEQLSRK